MALSKPRNTPRRADPNLNASVSVPTAASQTFYPGALVMTNAAGNLVPGATATGQKAVGVVMEQPSVIPALSYVSSAVAAADKLEVQLGQFKFSNSGGDPVVAADLFALCYIVDDETVCHTASGKSAAGIVMGIDDATSTTGAGIWVAVGATAIV